MRRDHSAREDDELADGENAHQSAEDTNGDDHHRSPSPLTPLENAIFYMLSRTEHKIGLFVSNTKTEFTTYVATTVASFDQKLSATLGSIANAAADARAQVTRRIDSLHLFFQLTYGIFLTAAILLTLAVLNTLFMFPGRNNISAAAAFVATFASMLVMLLLWRARLFRDENTQFFIVPSAFVCSVIVWGSWPKVCLTISTLFWSSVENVTARWWWLERFLGVFYTMDGYLILAALAVSITLLLTSQVHLTR